MRDSVNWDFTQKIQSFENFMFLMRFSLKIRFFILKNQKNVFGLRNQ